MSFSCDRGLKTCVRRLIFGYFIFNKHYKCPKCPHANLLQTTHKFAPIHTHTIPSSVLRLISYFHAAPCPNPWLDSAEKAP